MLVSVVHQLLCGVQLQWTVWALCRSLISGSNNRLCVSIFSHYQTESCDIHDRLSHFNILETQKMTHINLLELWELWEKPSSLSPSAGFWSSLSCHQVTYISRNSASGIGPFQHLTSPLPYIISDPRPQTQRSLRCDDSSSCLSPAVTVDLFQTGGCGSQYSSVWVFVPSRQTVSSAESHVGLVRAVMDSAEASSALQFSHYSAFTRQMFLTVTTFSLGGSRSQKRSFRTLMQASLGYCLESAAAVLYLISVYTCQKH